jgi:hypothetical protein
VRFLSFKKIGHLKFDPLFNRLEATENKECADTLSAYLARWRDRTEKIVVKASAKNLARVGRVREALNPIYLIVHSLLTKKEISEQEIREVSRPERIKQYLSLLEQNEIVQRTKVGYTYGNAFTSIFADVEEQKPKDFDETVKESVIAYIIKNNYAVIREVFRVSRLEPYVHMDNCYYQPALIAGKLLYQKEETLIRRYNSTYSTVSPLQLRPILNELAQVDALTTEGGYFLGTTKLFAEMQGMQTEAPDFTSLVA